LLKATEVTCGFLLLTNRFVPLALILLSPIIVQIAAFHFVLAHNGYPMVGLLVVLQTFLAWSYREYFRSALVAKAVPASDVPGPSSSRQPVTVS
jgi:hypothetical protein